MNMELFYMDWLIKTNKSAVAKTPLANWSVAKN
jgi:hypothetical protein